MRVPKDGPLGRAIAAHFNVATDDIDSLCLIVGVPQGTMMLHTFCCHEHMAQSVQELLVQPYLDMTTQEN
jgi:hypothetical protein